VVFSNKDNEAIEEDDECEEDQGNPCKVWLEMSLEHKSVTINALSLERGMESDIGKAN
jgi:hypothetical protein